MINAPDTMTATTRKHLLDAIANSERGGDARERYERFRETLHYLAENELSGEPYSRLKRYLSNTRVDNLASAEIHVLLRSMEDLRKTIVVGFRLGKR